MELEGVGNNNKVAEEERTAAAAAVTTANAATKSHDEANMAAASHENDETMLNDSNTLVTPSNSSESEEGEGSGSKGEEDTEGEKEDGSNNNVTDEFSTVPRADSTKATAATTATTATNQQISGDTHQYSFESITEHTGTNNGDNLPSKLEEPEDRKLPPPKEKQEKANENQNTIIIIDDSDSDDDSEIECWVVPKDASNTKGNGCTAKERGAALDALKAENQVQKSKDINFKVKDLVEEPKDHGQDSVKEGNQFGSGEDGMNAYLGSAATEKDNSIPSQTQPKTGAKRIPTFRRVDAVNLGDEGFQSHEDLSKALKEHRPGCKFRVVKTKGTTRWLECTEDSNHKLAYNSVVDVTIRRYFLEEHVGNKYHLHSHEPVSERPNGGLPTKYRDALVDFIQAERANKQGGNTFFPSVTATINHIKELPGFDPMEVSSKTIKAKVENFIASCKRKARKKDKDGVHAENAKYYSRVDVANNGDQGFSSYGGLFRSLKDFRPGCKFKVSRSRTGDNMKFLECPEDPNHKLAFRSVCEDGRYFLEEHAQNNYEDHSHKPATKKRNASKPITAVAADAIEESAWKKTGDSTSNQRQPTDPEETELPS